jgi:DNA-directed RNA polymerase subunit RPC12/RpoP
MTAEEKSRSIEGAGLILAKCPTCGAILNIQKGGTVRCEYCGNNFIFKESYGGKTRAIRNYYDLAYAAQEIGDDAGAYKYFTKVLELDSTEALAWFGKAYAALRSSDASLAGIKEVIALFKRVLPNAASEEEEQLQKAIQEVCYCYAGGFFESFRNRPLASPPVVNSYAVWELLEFADEILAFDNERLKTLVDYLYIYTFFDWSEREKKAKHYSDRIRQTEPAYLNPWEAEEARRRNLPPPQPFNWRPWAIGVLVVALATFLLLLCCMVFSLIDTLSNEPASPEINIGMIAEDVGSTPAAEGLAAGVER